MVENDGEWLVSIKIPSGYTSQVEGLCGDFNTDANNDMTTSGGIDVSGYPHSHAVFGNSWQVDDPEDPA